MFPYDFFSVSISSDEKRIAERARPAYVNPGPIVISFIDNSYAYGKSLPCVKTHLRRADIHQLCHRRRAIQSALSRQNRHQRGLKGLISSSPSASKKNVGETKLRKPR